ncbi:MAG TPA: hypothetical protein VIH05_09335 [Tepidiformaceae bacterium]
MSTGNELRERDVRASETLDAGTGAVLEADDCRELLDRWHETELGFVEDPRRAVEACDALVTEAMDRVAASFQADRLLLERKWSQGEPSTEDLRATIQRYRALFQRMLAV